MEKLLLSYLTDDFFIFIDDFAGTAEENSIPQFSFGTGGQEENCIVAKDGSHLMWQSTTIRRGNHLYASLRNRSTGKQIQRIRIGELFPKQTIVIATCGESLQAFAPICKNKMELCQFLITLNNCDKEHKLRYRVVQECKELALWFYLHNPEKEQEPDWGI